MASESEGQAHGIRCGCRLLIRGLNQLQRGLPVLPGQGAEGEQAEGIGAGLEVVAAQGVAQCEVGLAGVEVEDAVAAVILLGRARGAKQPQVAPAAAALIGPLLESTAGRATNPIG